MKPIEVLQQYFGYDTFRDGQERMIESILSGRDVFGIMPTGAGKSLCYQIPAMLMEGVSVIVSPLISLMNDQVKALNEAGIHAAYINSSLSESQIATALQRARNGQYKMIYVAPERLLTDRFLDFAANAAIPLVTVDEAHCVSQWGQDFRPGYLDIAAFVEKLKKRPVVAAFTATATERVREDVVRLVRLNDPDQLLTGFDRPNLFFSVRHDRGRLAYVVSYVREHLHDSGIIYCATRKNVETVHEKLVRAGVNAARYHAGLLQEERTRAQNAFIYDEAPVIVATNAFGMGIDKSNVRYVLHYNMPQSMEHYYQEAGRAGRDGAPAECILFFNAQDIVINRLLLSGKERNRQAKAEGTEDAGTDKADPYDVPYDNTTFDQEINSYDEYRLKEMTRYCGTSGCLRRFILQYFGDVFSGTRCDHCDNCLAETEELDVTDIAKQVMNCIFETNARFGAEKVIQILTGAKRKEMARLNAGRYKTYGVLAEASPELIRETIDALLAEEYITTSGNRYRTLSLTMKMEELKNPSVRIMVLHRKKVQKELSGGGKKISTKRMVRTTLNERESSLFEILRTLRRELASEQNIPPYMVFSDKALIEMCALKPKDRDEFLLVNGVGARKAETYGDAFLKRIRRFQEEEGMREEPVSSDVSAETDPAYIEVPALKEKDKAEFYLSPEEASRFQTTDNVYLAELVERLNLLRQEETVKRLFQKNIRTRLLEDEMIISIPVGKITDTALMPKGEKAGLILEETTSKSGIPYHLIRFSEEAQKMVLGWYTVR